MIDGILNISGISLDINEFKEKYTVHNLIKLKNTLTIRYKCPTTNMITVTKMYRIKNNKIIIPRFCLEMLYDKFFKFNIINNLHKPDDINLNYIGQSNNNQLSVINYTLKHIYNKKSQNNGESGSTIYMTAGCHLIDTEMILIDGNIKYVQDIKVGDKLLGDDNTTRNVISLYNNSGPIYKVKNSSILNFNTLINNNSEYFVSEDHILCLKYRYAKSSYDDFINEKIVIHWFNHNTFKLEKVVYNYNINNFFEIQKQAEMHFEKIQEKLFIEISVKDYLLLDNFIKNNLLGYKKIIKFKFLQVMLSPSHVGNYIRNNFISFIDKSFYIRYIYNKKFIRKNFIKGLFNIIEERVDDDIYKLSYNKDLLTGSHILLLKHIVFCCNSLGYTAYLSKYNEVTLIYKKKSLIYDIHISYHGIKPYYGFLVDKNHKYIMPDCTVTHNSGKTYLAMDLINRLNKKTLIVVPNTFLLNQWKELLVKYFPDNSIGEFYSKKKIDGDIIVIIIKSATIKNEFELKQKNNKEKIKLSSKEFYKQFGTVVLDESHMYCSKLYRKIFKMSQCMNMIGLTATPYNRNDKLDILSHYGCGKVINVEEIENYVKNDFTFTSHVEVVKYKCSNDFIDVKINPHTNLIEHVHLINNIISDPFRNKFIINKILELNEENKNIFIFSERRKHLEELYELLINNCKEKLKVSVPELNKNMVLYGGSSKEEISLATSYCNVIFTTYQYSTTGVSIVKMNALILATPRKSNSTQFIGRIFRLGKDQEKERKIIDIVDERLPLKYQYYKRKKTYSDRECEITISKIKYNEI